MNEVKTAFVEALERSGNALHELVGDQVLPTDPREGIRAMKHPNWSAKWQLVFPKDVIRGRLPKLRRSDPKLGDWPPFRAEDAQETIEMIEQIEAIAKIRTKDTNFHAAVSEALRPMREVVERYATE